MIPIAPFGIYGYVAQGSFGMVSLAYLIGMDGMVFTALSYARMSEAFPISGSVYSYAQRGINEHVGFFAGWVILLDYILIPSLLYLISASALGAIIPEIPSYVWLLIFIGIMFIVQTWVAALLWPDYTTFENADVAFYQIVELAGGPWLKWTTIIATALAWGIANSLVAQAAISRILYSMARDKKLPGILAKVHTKYQTPYVSILIVAAISLIVTLSFSSHIARLSSLVNFGALTAFLFLHLSVINYFLRKLKSKDYLNHLLYPLIGLVIISYVWYSLDAASKQFGFIWMGIGIVYMIYLKLTKKDASIAGDL